MVYAMQWFSSICRTIDRLRDTVQSNVLRGISEVAQRDLRSRAVKWGGARGDMDIKQNEVDDDCDDSSKPKVKNARRH
jgi:hypothetical protein